MLNKVMLYILPMVLILFSCVLALPEEEVTEPVAFVTEPTPVPLEQSTPTTAFDVPDTPVPTTTPIPSTTPTTAVVSPIAEVEQDTDYVLVYREEPFQEGQSRRIDQIHKTLSLEQDPLHRNDNADALSTPIDFGLEGVDIDFVTSVSPNGQYVVLATNTQLGGAIPYIYDQETKTIRSLLADSEYNPLGYPLGWRRDSQKLLYGGHHLWIIDMTTGEEISFIQGEVNEAHFSPNGDYVVFIARADAILRPDELAASLGIGESERSDLFLWVVESTGGTPRRIFDYEVSINNLVGWSSEGLLVNFPYAPDDAPKKNNVPSPPPPNVGPLWTINLNGQKQYNFISSSDFLQVNGTLSPDRTKLAFTRSEGGLSHCDQIETAREKRWCLYGSRSLYVIDLRQDKIVKIGNGRWVTWSPDSQQLAFESYQSEKPEIWVAQADGRQARLVIASADDRYPELPFWLRR